MKPCDFQPSEAGSANDLCDARHVTAYGNFIRQCRKKLEHIAYATDGEHQRDDVAQEAWLMADEVASKTGVPKDFTDPQFQSVLFAYVYQKLVRYTEMTVRHAASLDHAPRHAEDADGVHPIMHTLVGDDGKDPLDHLLASEAPKAAPCTDDGILIQTGAGAWVMLLRQCGHRMYAVAACLLVSLPHAYHCMAKARRRATYQQAIPLHPCDAIIPRLGAWRRERYLRIPRQLMLDFDPKLDFPAPASEIPEE